MSARPGAVESLLWLMAVGAVGGALAWPGAEGGAGEQATRKDAGDVLRRVAEAQQAYAAQHRRYAPVGPQRQATLLSLPGLELPAEAGRFSVDAVPGDGDTVALRVVSRPEAVRSGEAAPVLVKQQLGPPADEAPAAESRLSAALRAP